MDMLHVNTTHVLRNCTPPSIRDFGLFNILTYILQHILFNKIKLKLQTNFSEKASPVACIINTHVKEEGVLKSNTSGREQPSVTGITQ